MFLPRIAAGLAFSKNKYEVWGKMLLVAGAEAAYPAGL